MKKFYTIILLLIVVLGVSGCSISFNNKKEECPQCDECQKCEENTTNNYANYIKGLKNSQLVKEIANSSNTYEISLYPGEYDAPGVVSLSLNGKGTVTIKFDKNSSLNKTYPDGYKVPGKYINAFGPLAYGNGGCYKFALLKEDGTISLIDNCGISNINDLALKEVNNVKNVINVISVGAYGEVSGASNIYAIDINGNIISIK